MPADLRALAALFLRLGTTAFGGPAAHIAMMEDEVVRRRAWLTRAEFLDLVGATHLIPGPNSTELAIHIGYRRAGWPGLLVAGVCFIAPAMALVWLAAWGYVRYGSLPAVAGILAGVKPVVVAVIAQALWGLGRTALKSALTTALGVAAFIAVLLGTHELVALAVAAGIAMLDARLTAGGLPPLPPLSALAVAPTSVSTDSAASATAGATASATVGVTAGAAGVVGLAGAAAAGSAALLPLFLVFLKAGSFLFGSGYVLLAFLRSDLVIRLGWLTETQLLDAIAVGQFTPGPVFTTATFVGYLLAGNAGAIVATVGIFLPAFVFVALSAPLLPKLRSSTTLSAALDGVNVASLALMAAVCIPLAADAYAGALTVLLGVTALALLVRWRVNASWLVLGGGLVGWALL